MARMAVLGSGVMGHGIAQVSALAGHEVAMRDIDRALLDRAMEKIRWSLDKMASKGKITAAEADAAHSRITPETDLASAVGGASMVVEAVPEVMDLKRRVYAELDAAVRGRDVVFASNTSTLPITEMATALERPEMFVGVHFFNPPQLMRLVEVIPGQKTSRAVVDGTLEYVRSLGKEPVLCARDVPGFIVNRLFIPLVHEACHVMDADGRTKEEIDSAVRFRLGFPMGIFELADYTGLDVVHKATQEMHKRDAGVARPHPEVARLYEAGRLGQKSGEGFYKYSEGKYERVGLSEGLAGSCDPVRLAAVLANNAAWIVANGVADIETVERAASLGLGMRKSVREIVSEAGAGAIASRLRELASSESAFYEPHPSLASLA